MLGVGRRPRCSNFKIPVCLLGLIYYLIELLSCEIAIFTAEITTSKLESSAKLVSWNMSNQQMVAEI